MSYRRDRIRKEKKRAKMTEYERGVASKIRRGKYPKFHLAKEAGSADLLERKAVKIRLRFVKGGGSITKRRLSWRQVSTFATLTKAEGKK